MGGFLAPVLVAVVSPSRLDGKPTVASGSGLLTSAVGTYGAN